MTAIGKVKLPECWGHRGASVAFPENTLASFDKAIRDGADGIESDVHVSLDDVILMFHDPSLDRTTNGTGLIREKRWHGPDGMEHLRTRKQPAQSIPTLAETVALFMLPENRHVKLHLDIKVHNDPVRLFSLMNDIISAQPDWETTLAPRILLGLWHTKFVLPANKFLPYCQLAHIGVNIGIARDYFWDCCEVISLHFSVWASWEGQRFMAKCKKAGKKILVWTVNEPHEMAECVRWGADVVMTDVPNTFLTLRDKLAVDYDKTLAQYSRTFLWTTFRYYFPRRRLFSLLVRCLLRFRVGKFVRYEVTSPNTVMAK